MCGFVGFFGGIAINGESKAILCRMTDTLVHRGPDDSGIWLDSGSAIALGHRRLSILDLTPAGHQPMVSAGGRFVIAFNGEIYNHLELRKELELAKLAPDWRGHSDTETLLAGFSSWGVAATLQKSIGMFAFALWNTDTHALTLGRDRLGEKPLYYGWQGQGDSAVFLFGSELKALKEHPAFQSDINRDALALLMRHNYIPAPYSIWQGINKLLPGCILTISKQQPNGCVEAYWSGKEIVEAGLSSPFVGTSDEAVSALEKILLDAVGKQMLSDVPLGAFLSGGVDSSAIVALMQAQSSKAVRTFSIGFNEAQYNEAIYAKAVAKHLGTEHNELYVTSNDALNVIPNLPAIYDEPFADSSQIPTFLVAQMARQQVTVALSGDAGDELFCGYSRYFMANRIWNKLSYLPLGVRRAMAGSITTLSPASWNKIANPLVSLFPNNLAGINVGDKLHKGANLLECEAFSDIYRNLVSHWQNSESLVLGATEPLTVLTSTNLQPKTPSEIERMMAVDMLSYLPDDILAKVDRAAMSVSLESRVPFLDHRVVEFAWQLPLKYKLRNGVGKWALREVLFKYVPKTLIERPKMGFGVPIDDWLRGPLRDWAEGLLNETRLLEEGYFNPEMVREKWNEHLSSKRNWQYLLWNVLMFQAWLQEQ